MANNTGASGQTGQPENEPGEGQVADDQHQAILDHLNRLGGLDVSATSDAESEGAEDSNEPRKTDPAQATPEETETPEGDDSQEGQEEPEEQQSKPEEEDDSDLPQGVRRTLHELRDQRRQLKEEREQLRSEIAELREQMQASAGRGQDQTQAPPGGLLAKASTPQALEKIYRDVETLVDSVEDQLVRVRRSPEAVAQWLKQQNVALPAGEDGAEDLSPEAVEETLLKIRRTLNSTLKRDIPARAEFLKNQAGYVNFVKENFDWFANPKSKEYQDMLQAFRDEPVLATRPDAVRICALMIEGRKVLEARMKAKAANSGKPAPRPAPSAAGRATTAAPRVNPRAVQSQNAREALRPRDGRQPTAVPLLQELLNQ